MATTRSKYKRPKRRSKYTKRKKAKIKQTVSLRKKQEATRLMADTMPTQMPRSNGVVFKVKVKRK